MVFFGFDDVETAESAEFFRNDDGAVGLLIVFHNGNQQTVGCRRGADGVDILALVFILEADVETAALELSQIGVAGDFTVAAESREPGFNIILLVSRGSEVADAAL